MVGAQLLAWLTTIVRAYVKTPLDVNNSTVTRLRDFSIGQARGSQLGWHPFKRIAVIEDLTQQIL